MPIDTLIFDLDDTLIADEASADVAIVETCRRVLKRSDADCQRLCEVVRGRARELWRAAPEREYCVRVGTSSWEGLWMDIRHPDCEELVRLRNWLPGYCRSVWLSALEAAGQEGADCADLLAETFPRVRREMDALCEDTLPALKRMSARYGLGLLTNGVVDLQQEKIESAGIASYFRAVVISGEIGIGKPDRAVFDLVLGRLGATASRTVMIGNSLQADVAGARNAGLRSVWLRRGSPGRQIDFAPDATIDSLWELDEALDRIDTAGE